MKKLLTIFTTASAMSLLCFAQAATDGFVVPLDQDLTNSKGTALLPPPIPENNIEVSKVNLSQGLWIEATSSNKAIIRDIASGEKSGYEFDNSHFISEANWWFWGNVGKNFQLNAEISVWDFDKTLYQSNSYAANVPDVTWGDGLQTLVSMPFSFIYNMNDDGVGALNKLGFSVTSPLVNAKFGYGNLKENGMIDWEGIFHVIKRYDDHGKGFTELSLGKDLRQFGKINLNATAGLSMVNRNSSTYGTYELVTMDYGEDSNNPFINAALSFGSITDEEELFFYNESNKNDFSAYIASHLLEKLLLEAHGFVSFGTDTDFSKQSLAGALRATWNDDRWMLRLKQSVAGADAASTKTYTWSKPSTIGADTAVTRADLSFKINDTFAFDLDEVFTLKNLSDAEDYKEESFTLRNQPGLTVNLAKFINMDATACLYTVVSLDKPYENAKDTNLFTYFEEAGLELTFKDLPYAYVKSFVFDYALQRAYSNNSDFNKEYNALFNSVMLTLNVTDNFDVNAAALFRSYSEDKDTNQPLGFALGCSMKKTKLPGHPMAYAHFTYGMDPYEDVNYSVYRADDPRNEAEHRTFLLNSLEKEMTSSYIRIGFIWDL